MAVKGLKIENSEHHDYFVRTVHKLLTDIGFRYSVEEIDKMSVDSSYYLYIHNRKTKKWHLGVWAVGKWGIKEDVNGNIINCGYGVDSYKPLTICVFLVHDWTYDKFRPTYSDWSMLIEHNEKFDKVVDELRYIFKHPISSYYNIVDGDYYNYQHKEKNRYVAYIKGWYYNEFQKTFKRIRRRCFGYLFTKVLMLSTFFDKNVHYSEYKFRKDEWNNEFEVAIVFKYGDTEWNDWVVWKKYNNIVKWMRNHCDMNINADFNYLDENGNMPKNIWRGIYWEE